MYETTEARRQSRRYRELSLRDPLTGLYNRRYVDEQLPVLLGGARDGSRGEVVSVALLDLDHFKRVNDTFSHDVGDQVLRVVGEMLQRTGTTPGSGGPGSFAARMGGEEFLLVLVGADPDAAARELEEVRRAVSGHPWSDEVVEGLSVTISVGLTGTTGVRDPAPSSLLSRADALLYQAKTLGRDRVVSDLS